MSQPHPAGPVVPSSAPPCLELGELGLDRGGHLLVKHALRALPVGGRLAVRGRAPELLLHLRTWCRGQGHPLHDPAPGDAAIAIVERGGAEEGRWRGAMRAGHADLAHDGAVVEHPPATWGLAARGAMIEAGSPAAAFGLSRRLDVWADEAPALYAQAAAAQWDPATAIPWDTPFELPAAVEDAVVQVMTYLIENETAALVVPARFLGQVHPHFREVMQLLAIQVADEARHIEVFTRRARLHRAELGLSTAGGQASLQSLLAEPDFALASFLLSVLGEGSFLSLLWFLHEHAPDPVTREVARLTAQDEARHVAFGLAHLRRHATAEPGLLSRLALAVHRRHETLRHTAGLNEEVFDALVLLAAGAWEPSAIARGFEAVQQLERDMDEARRRRLRRLGFPEADARALSELHTRNFM